MGLGFHEFMCMTYKEYALAYQGYWLRHNRYLEGSRLIAHALLAVNTKKGGRVPKASNIWPLLTDDIAIQNVIIPTKEEMEEIKKRMFKK